MAATVSFFSGSNRPAVAVSRQVPHLTSRTTGSADGSGSENRFRLSARPGATPTVRPEKAAISRSHVPPPLAIGSARTAMFSSSSATDRNRHPVAQSRLPGEVSAKRASAANGGPSAKSTVPSINSFQLRTARSFNEKQINDISEPLIFTDPGSIVPAEPARDAALHAEATQLAADLAAPGHAPDSPEYLDHWNRTVDLSNQLLRQRHGGQVWMAHHIQSHHLRTLSSAENR